jgi:D-citramalate synthase
MVEVMDTTLRDGEQMKDVSYTLAEKLTISRMLLEEVNVDRVEIASARVSSGERQTVSSIIDWAVGQGFVERIEILGYTDITKSVDWISDVGGRVMNILAKGSITHVEKQLRKTADEHIADIRKTIEYAVKKGVICNIYLEVWSNGMIESPEFVYALINAIKDTPVRRFMLPDTLGIFFPEQVTTYISDLIRRYPDLHFEFHGHNDYGCATANTIAAVKAGVRGIHCTVNGMGERAGNTSLDEAVVGIHDFLGIKTGVNEKKLYIVSEAVEVFSGKRIPSNKPIAGYNVFTQTAGIHADGDKKGNLYANPLLPERFNRKRQYALGKLSGKSNLDYNLKELGIELNEEQKKKILERIIELGDRKETITQEDLPYIITDVLERPCERRFNVESCIIVSSKGMKSIATIKLLYKKNETDPVQEYEETGQGDGGYDAFMDAIKKIAKKLDYTIPELVDYQVTIPPGGQTDALVQCSITWRNHKNFVTKGVNSDQVLAAAEATEKMLNLL